jgi:hypothetical protein
MIEGMSRFGMNSSFPAFLLACLVAVPSCGDDAAGPQSDLTGEWQQVYGEVLCNGILATSSDEIVAVGAKQDAISFDGTAWHRQDVHEFPQLWGVWGNSSDSVFAVGRFGTALLRHKGKWSPIPIATTADLNDVCGESSSHPDP